MDIPESAASQDVGKVFDRNTGEWINIKDVPLWKLILSQPMIWAVACMGLMLLFVE